MNIVEFLEARIGEDEAVAQEASAYYNYDDDDPWHFYVEQYAGMQMGEGGYGGTSETPITVHASLWSPARVLAECAVKRAILGNHSGSRQTIVLTNPGNQFDRFMQLCNYDQHAWPCADLLALTLPYTNSPDFDPAWQVQP